MSYENEEPFVVSKPVLMLVLTPCNGPTDTPIDGKLHLNPDSIAAVYEVQGRTIVAGTGGSYAVQETMDYVFHRLGWDTSWTVA